MISSDFFKKVIGSLESLEIPYFVTGSFASSWFGEPRLTFDVDVVVVIPLSKAELICDAFPAPEFYCSPIAAKEAIRSARQFNVIQTATSWKADLIIAKDSEFDRSRFDRRRRLMTPMGIEAWFSSPEDVILKKLDFFRQGASEKHLRDIAGILKVQGKKIDQPYIDQWIEKLKLKEEWILVNEWRANPPKQLE